MNKLQISFYTNNSEEILNKLEMQEDFNLCGNSPKRGKYHGFRNGYETSIYMIVNEGDIFQSPMKEEITFLIEGNFAEETILAYHELKKFLAAQEKPLKYMG